MSAARLRARLLLLALAANLLGVISFGAEDAYACSCTESSPEEQLQRSDTVFSGEVVSFEENLVPGPPGRNLDPVAFDVEESWKGVEENEVTVLGYGDEASCGLRFQEGNRYLVYAYRDGEGDNEPLTTSICAGTPPLTSAGAVPRSPETKATTPATSTSEAAIPASAGSAWRDVGSAAVAGSLALLLLASVGVLAVRYRRR